MTTYLSSSHEPAPADLRIADGGSDPSRDATLDDTWQRVASAAAAAEGRHAMMWTYQFLNGFRRLHMLPDERLLRIPGAGRTPRAAEDFAAVVNVAAFVDRSSDRCRFDEEGFIAAAELAVRFLDDAAVVAHGDHPHRLRIGVIGLANALDMLELPYDSAKGHQQAATVARALAEGCLRASIEMAEERGCRFPVDANGELVAFLRRSGMPPGLVERALRSGLYHEALTAIDPHPLLARLADVADATNPMPPAKLPASRDFSDQVGMRSAFQPWIDEPISDLFAAWHPASHAAVR